MEEQITAKDRLGKIDAILDEYEQRAGLTKFSQEFTSAAEIEKLTNLSREEMDKLHPDDCIHGATLLNSFCFHLQRSINRESSRMSWADSQLKKYVTPRITQYRGGSFNQLFDMAALDDDFSRKLVEIKDYAKQRLDRLSFLTGSIKNIADCLMQLERSKRYKNG